MTSRFTSLAEIIERVYRTAEYDNIPWQDAAEDCLDILRLIGVPQSYRQKTTNGQGDNPVPIIINDFRGELPEDMAVPGSCRLLKLDASFNIQTFMMMTESQDLFYQSPTVSEEYLTSYLDYVGSIAATSLDRKMDEATDDVNQGDLTDATNELNDVIKDIRQAQGRIIGASLGNTDDFFPKYKLNDNYIFTNFKNGFVEMTYKAYPIDNMGMPMVPDNIRFIKAVEWYLISRIDYKRWRTTRSPSDQKIWEVSDREALWYIASARSAARAPSVDMMESIKRMLMRSIVKINEHNTGFKNTNVNEHRKF